VTKTALDLGQVEWADGTTMSVVGLRAAFVDNVRVDVGQRIFARVASAAAITILSLT
jgi:hypothetical protein